MSQQQQSKCVATAATDTVVLLPRDDDDSSRNTASSRRCKLLLVTALILCSGLLCLCLALIVLVAFSGRMSACPDVDVSVVSGVFLLQRFGSDFDNYLQSLDIPEHVFPLVKNSSELLEVSTDADCYWQVYMRTGKSNLCMSCTIRSYNEFMNYDRRMKSTKKSIQQNGGRKKKRLSLQLLFSNFCHHMQRTPKKRGRGN